VRHAGQTQGGLGGKHGVRIAGTSQGLKAKLHYSTTSPFGGVTVLKVSTNGKTAIRKVQALRDKWD
jgi:hypothetical protein